MLNPVHSEKIQVHKKQHGVTLIEALVSMMVLALGVLGLLGVQLRTMVDSNNANYTATAARLGNDLFERMKSNPSATMATNTSFDPADPLNTAQWAWLSNYVLAWDSDGTAATTCETGFCTPVQQAQHDLNRWKLSVASSLPNGNAQVIRPTGGNGRQMIVIIGWRSNEKGTSPVSISIPDTTITPPDACGSTHTCYLAYGQP